jgi:hypothetical protein
MLAKIADEWLPLIVFLCVVSILLILAVLVALFATMHFGVPALEDFKNPSVPFRDGLIGTAIVWAICLCAWVVAVRCIVFALRRYES